MTADTTAVPRRKLIEVALPLEKINAESAREKSIRHGHPSTLHLWWARRPLAAARAVLFAQLVDDPSSFPDRFPTDEAVAKERRRLHEIIEQLVVWENAGDENLLRRAHEEILASTDGNPPPILDPFAGGGTIPLEAQRLGLEAHASDLNPVAVLINKALIEIPPKFAGRAPVFPGAADAQITTWPRASGLAEDVRRYGQWMRDEAEKRIGHLYPKAKLPDGSEATVIAWIWARTVTCPNPACGIAMPLVRSWWLGKKKGKEAYIVPTVVNGKVEFTIGHDPKKAPTKEDDGTVSGRTGATCIACGAHVTADAVHSQLDVATPPAPVLMATVAVGQRSRIYLAPDETQRTAALNARDAGRVIRRDDAALSAAARGTFGGNAQGRRYGFFQFSDYFTDRQLVALTSFSDLISVAHERVLEDARLAGMDDGDCLEAGGVGARAYADGIATYLGFAVSRLTNKSASVCSWDSSTKMEAVRSVFARQAIPMNWEFAESNPWGGSGGDYLEDLRWVSRVIDNSISKVESRASQINAIDSVRRPLLISTDPPYYDNIVYSDLSDFFYVWLRRSLRSVYPRLLSTMLTPKSEELVANPYRQNGKEGAHKFFEDGFREVFQRARESALNDYPITVYYAFKQQDSDDRGEASTGWETLLEGMIRSGWAITATWPMRSELGNRMISQGTNALASSIVLALRPRPESASTIDRRGFINALKDELPDALRELQQGAIAPVDLPQAAIGPGMAVFSRYSGVLTDDGSKMTVRAALARINEILDEVLAEQEGDFDPDTRFAIAWFRQHGFEAGSFGNADNMARARNASLEHLERSGILISRAGKVTLLSPAALGEIYAGREYDPATDPHISTWEVVMHLSRALTEKGVPAAATLLSRVPESIDRDLCKELAFLLFTIAEDSKRTQVAIEFNSLGTAWNDIVAESRTASTQLMLGT